MLSGFLSGVSLCVALLSGLAGYYVAAAVAFMLGVRAWFYAAALDRVRRMEAVPVARVEFRKGGKA